jgi:hypothetical protein
MYNLLMWFLYVNAVLLVAYENTGIFIPTVPCFELHQELVVIDTGRRPSPFLRTYAAAARVIPTCENHLYLLFAKVQENMLIYPYTIIYPLVD